MKKNYQTLSIILVSLLLLAACGQTKTEEPTNLEPETSMNEVTNPIAQQPANSNINFFMYKYGAYGSRNSEGVIFKIERQDTSLMLIAEDTRGNSLNVKKEIAESSLVEIENIIAKNDVESWNGFHQFNGQNGGGNYFNLVIKYNDHEIIAEGKNNFPANYDATHAALSEYLLSLSNS